VTHAIKNDGKGPAMATPTFRGLRTLARMIGCDVVRDDEERCYRVGPADLVTPRTGLHTVEFWGPGRGAKEQARIQVAKWIIRQSAAIMGGE